MEKKITAPFSPDQVQYLNERQCHVDGGMALHPFTCPNRNDGLTHDRVSEGGERGLLIATPGGWVCPHCEYTLSWAYASMAVRPTPVADLFRDHPVLLEIFGRPRLDQLEEVLAQYKALAASGRNGADIMVACLERRRTALLSEAAQSKQGICA